MTTHNHTNMETEYKSIEANNTTYILNEDGAIKLYHAIAREFGWSGTFFVPDDIRDQINFRREADGKEALDDATLEEAVNVVLESREWTRHLPEWLTQEGWDVINSAIYEYVEQEGN